MIVPEKIYKLQLSSTEINVYQYLCSRANKQGECFPSQTTKAAWSPQSQRTAKPTAY